MDVRAAAGKHVVVIQVAMNCLPGQRCQQGLRVLKVICMQPAHKGLQIRVAHQGSVRINDASSAGKIPDKFAMDGRRLEICQHHIERGSGAAQILQQFRALAFYCGQRHARQKRYQADSMAGAVPLILRASLAGKRVDQPGKLGRQCGVGAACKQLHRAVFSIEQRMHFLKIRNLQDEGGAIRQAELKVLVALAWQSAGGCVQAIQLKRSCRSRACGQLRGMFNCGHDGGLGHASCECNL